MIDVPVLIAGGGPVGVTLAMDLAWRGVRSVVLETRRNLAPNPRCNTTNARSMEVFRRLGCADAVRNAGLPPYHSTDIVYMTSMNGEELVRYRRPTTQDFRDGKARGIGADWPTPEPQHFLSQLYLEPVLRQHAVDAYGIDLRTGQELIGFDQDGDGVVARGKDVDTGQIFEYRASYLVGADGGASRVRQAVGARLEGIPTLGNTCSLYIRAPALRRMYLAHPGWMYRFLGGAVAVAIDGEDGWLLHIQVPPGLQLETFDPRPAMFAAVGESFDYNVINIARWTARAMVANKFRERRVFLAGDAAHIWIPFGGFGMNAGIGDAISLGWLLAGVTQGWLDPKALDAFECERSPLGAKVAAQAATWIRDLTPLLRPEPTARDGLLTSESRRRELGARIQAVNLNEFENLGMQFGIAYEHSPLIAYDGTEAPVFALDAYQESSWPGARAPHVWRNQTGESLYDQLGKGFTLLRIGSDAPRGAGLVEETAARGVPLKVIDLEDAAAISKYQGYGLVLVRPDQHIAWRSRVECEYPAEIIDRVTGRLVLETSIREYSSTELPGRYTVSCGMLWHRGRLLNADATGRELWSLDIESNQQHKIATLPEAMSGMTLLPDDRILLAFPGTASLRTFAEGELAEYCKLPAATPLTSMHLAADATSGVYVYVAGDSREGGRIYLIEPSGGTRCVLDSIASCDGMAILPDGGTLLLRRNHVGRVLQCRVNKDGSLGEVRPFLSLEQPAQGSGLAVESSGALWLCMSNASASAVRYDSAGRLTARVSTPGGRLLGCAVSRTATVFFCGRREAHESRSADDGSTEEGQLGWIATIDVD